jgi:hypothetical protein
MLRVLATIVCGVLAGLVAIAMTRLDPRYATAGVGALAVGVGLICLGSPRRAMQGLVAFVAVTLPLGYSPQFSMWTSLFPTERAADQYVDHMAAVAGISISAAMIGCAAVLALSLFTARGEGVLSGARLPLLPASGAALLFAAASCR